MNIFYLHEDPAICAQSLFDVHVRKMILESAQLMCTAHRMLDGHLVIERNKIGSKMKRWHFDESDERETVFYKSTHFNHPSCIWTRASSGNYSWHYQYWLEMLKEYTHRYGKHHAAERLIPYLAEPPKNIPIGPFTQVTPAMDAEFIISSDSIVNYRNYYLKSKMRFMAYTKRDTPSWILDSITKE